MRANILKGVLIPADVQLTYFTDTELDLLKKVLLGLLQSHDKYQYIVKVHSHS